MEGLRKIAEERGITMTEALRQTIESQRYLNDEMKKGYDVAGEGSAIP